MPSHYSTTLCVYSVWIYQVITGLCSMRQVQLHTGQLYSCL